MLGLETIDDDFGFFFGLLQLLGLIPFPSSLDTDPPDVSVAVVAALAGLLTEEAVRKLKNFFAQD